MVGWFVGAGINLVGSIAINLGTNVMKLGHNKRALIDLPEDKKPSIRSFKEWQIGMAFFIVGNIANFVSFGYAAQSLLAALGSVQFVSNVFFASFVLKEKITLMVVTATGCIIGGCLVLVLFGNHSSSDYTVSQLLDLYKKPAYIVYLVMMFVFVGGSYIMYLHGKAVSGQKGRERSIWVSILPVTYSIFSALLGTQSVLFSKSLSVLLRTTVSGDSQLGNWYTWVTLVCFLISAGFWVTRLNKGLRLFPAMIIVPLMQICWTLFSIVSGMIYFQEYETFSPSRSSHGTLSAIMFTIGVLIVFVGVFLLTKSGGSKQAEHHEQEEKVAADSLELVNNPAYESVSQDDVGRQQGPGTPGAGLAVVAGAGKQPASPRIPSPDIPRKDAKLSMDTLRFTSLASNTLNMNQTYKSSPNRGLGAGGLGSSEPGIPTADSLSYGRDALQDTVTTTGVNVLHNNTVASAGKGQQRQLSTIADGDADGEGREYNNNNNNNTTRMMGTLKKGAKKITHALRKDFNVDLEDFKQMIGMGQGGYMPALSLFAVPAVDLTATRTSRSQKAEPTGRQALMLSSLPQSRFYGAADVESGMDKVHSDAAATSSNYPTTPAGHKTNKKGSSSSNNNTSSLGSTLRHSSAAANGWREAQRAPSTRRSTKEHNASLIRRAQLPPVSFAAPSAAASRALAMDSHAADESQVTGGSMQLGHRQPGGGLQDILSQPVMQDLQRALPNSEIRQAGTAAGSDVLHVKHQRLPTLADGVLAAAAVAKQADERDHLRNVVTVDDMTMAVQPQGVRQHAAASLPNQAPNTQLTTMPDSSSQQLPLPAIHQDGHMAQPLPSVLETKLDDSGTAHRSAPSPSQLHMQAVIRQAAACHFPEHLPAVSPAHIMSAIAGSAQGVTTDYRPYSPARPTQRMPMHELSRETNVLGQGQPAITSNPIQYLQGYEMYEQAPDAVYNRWHSPAGVHSPHAWQRPISPPVQYNNFMAHPAPQPHPITAYNQQVQAAVCASPYAAACRNRTASEPGLYASSQHYPMTQPVHMPDSPTSYHHPYNQYARQPGSPTSHQYSSNARMPGSPTFHQYSSNARLPAAHLLSPGASPPAPLQPTLIAITQTRPQTPGQLYQQGAAGYPTYTGSPRFNKLLAQPVGLPYAAMQPPQRQAGPWPVTGNLPLMGQQQAFHQPTHNPLNQ